MTAQTRRAHTRHRAPRSPLDLSNTLTITCRRERSGRLDTQIVSAFLLPHLAIHLASYPTLPGLACSERTTGMRVVTFAPSVRLEVAIELAIEIEPMFVDMPRVDARQDRSEWTEEFREWWENTGFHLRWWKQTRAEMVIDGEAERS